MKEYKLTKQGVRDLGKSNSIPKIIIPRICDHRRMRWHCHPKNCGHLECKGCGLFGDVGVQK